MSMKTAEEWFKQWSGGSYPWKLYHQLKKVDGKDLHTTNPTPAKPGLRRITTTLRQMSRQL